MRLRDRLVAGDDTALTEVYDRWATLVHSLALRIVGDRGAAEDITQDVFVHVWERPESYDPARGPLRAWLSVVARSRALDWLRRGRVRARYQAISPPVTVEGPVDEALMSDIVAKAVRSAVADLPEPQRKAIRLAYFGGHTYREVARQLGIPEGTAKSRLRVALRTIADRLTADGIVDQ